MLSNFSRGLERMCWNNFDGREGGWEELVVGRGELVLSQLCCPSIGGWWVFPQHISSSFQVDALVGRRAYSVHWRRIVCCASYIMRKHSDIYLLKLFNLDILTAVQDDLLGFLNSCLPSPFSFSLSSDFRLNCNHSALTDCLEPVL